MNFSIWSSIEWIFPYGVAFFTMPLCSRYFWFWNFIELFEKSLICSALHLNATQLKHIENILALLKKTITVNDSAWLVKDETVQTTYHPLVLVYLLHFHRILSELTCMHYDIALAFHRTLGSWALLISESSLLQWNATLADFLALLSWE